MTDTQPDPAGRRDPGIVAVLGAFVLNGALLGSWAPRVPALAEQIGAQEGALGLSLLGASVGMIAASLLAGRLCAAFGARVVMTASGVAGSAMLPALGLAGSPAALGLLLIALGAMVGVMDVAMNVAGVTATRRTGRSIMPLFHAAFSLGTLAGSVGAAVAAGQGVAPVRHFAIVAVVCGGVTLAIARWIPVEELLKVPVRDGRAGKAPFRRPALWLLGAVALCASIAEGATADWSALFGVQERGLSEATGALIYSCFSVTMACTRLCGETIQRRWGAPRMLIGGSVIGGLGLTTAVLAPSPALTFTGFAIAGIGLAYASPVVMELSGAAGRRPDGGGGEREVAFATTIAYSGFLLGPPMVGGIAEFTSLPVALGAVAALVLLIGPLTVAAGAFRRRELSASGERAATLVPAQDQGAK
ncbi:MFS transporter [Streptomyces sp. V2]|uniref:MFS transporter n=1 Tax=Streptomyces niveiscabiei TaxID=164115 RepID=A0ABW9HWJ8_9ACTN|nr:MFS transporter [Streptomyces sp. V2]PWG13615.1 MFS transporter [Streptomyces sp. V2]